MVWEDSADVTTGLMQSPDMRVRAGEPFFGYPAPLENYLEVLPIGEEGDDTILSWVDDFAPVYYFVPLYEENGTLAGAMFAWRETGNTLLAHRFDDEYASYLATRDHLDCYLGLQEAQARQAEHQILWTLLGSVALVKTDAGTYGQFFSDYYAEENLSQLHDFDILSSKVMRESELVQLFETMSDQIAQLHAEESQ